jgi:hypothetical protein
VIEDSFFSHVIRKRGDERIFVTKWNKAKEKVFWFGEDVIFLFLYLSS